MNPRAALILKKREENLTTEASFVELFQKSLIMTIILSSYFSLFNWFALNDPTSHIPCILYIVFCAVTFCVQ